MFSKVFTDKLSFGCEGVDFQRGNEAPKLGVTVVFTTPRYSLLALRRAAELAEGLECVIRILVPETVPFPLPVSSPAVCRNFRKSHLRTLASHSIIATEIQVVLCRDPLEGLRQTLRADSLVLIGGRESWWPTREKRLAQALLRLGHRVIFLTR